MSINVWFLAITAGMSLQPSGQGAVEQDTPLPPSQQPVEGRMKEKIPTPPTRRPESIPEPEKHYADLAEATETEGVWDHSSLGAGNSKARFIAVRELSSIGRADEVLFMLDCRVRSGEIRIARIVNSKADRTMRLRTKGIYRAFRAETLSNANMIWLSANDPIFDDLAGGEQRFAVELDGTTTLYLPTGPVTRRVIEDCR